MSNEPATIEALQAEIAALRQQLADVEQTCSLERRLNAAIIEASDLLVVVLDYHGHVVRFNRACEETTGFDATEMLGKFVWDFLIPPEQIEGVKGVFHQLAFDHMPNRYEHDWMTKDGQRRRLAWSNTLLRNEAGDVTHIVGTAYDVTTHRQTAEELRQSQALIQDLIDNSPSIIYAKDTDWCLTLVNREFCNLLHLPPEDIIGKNDYNLFPKEAIDAIRANDEHILATGKSQTIEETLPGDDGIHTYLSTKFPLYDSNGTLYGIGGITTDITERKQATEELHTFKTLVENALDAIGFAGMDGTILYTNRAYQELTGYGPGTTIPEHFEPEYAAYVQREVLPTIMQHGNWRGNLDITCADGRYITVHSTTFLLSDADGNPTAMANIFRDITEQQRQEQELRTNQMLLQGIVDNVPAVVYAKDCEGRYILANTQSAAMVGLTPAEVLGKRDADFLPPEVAARFEANDQAIFQTGTTFEHEETLFVNGEQKTYMALGFPIHDEQGTIYAVGGVSTDITEQQSQAQAIQASAERLRTIIEKIPVGVCITNQGYLYEYVNSAYCEIYRYTEEELLGQPFMLVVPPENQQAMRDLHDKFLDEGAEIRGEWTVQAKDGTSLTILADAAAITGEDGMPKKVTFVTDITELRQSEEERQMLQQQIIDAQQAAIRELSTPLIPLSNNVVLMPLIGSIDTSRAQQVMEALLEGIADYQADVAILDITGVSVVDTQVANALIQAAQAVRLLGAQVVLTGIGPTMAQTLVHLGADLSSIQTRGSLQSAILDALHLR